MNWKSIILLMSLHIYYSLPYILRHMKTILPIRRVVLKSLSTGLCTVSPHTVRGLGLKTGSGDTVYKPVLKPCYNTYLKLSKGYACIFLKLYAQLSTSQLRLGHDHHVCFDLGVCGNTVLWLAGTMCFGDKFKCWPIRGQRVGVKGQHLLWN